MKFWLLFLLTESLAFVTTEAQRFLRDGFTNSMDEEFKYETSNSDDTEGPRSGLPRELVVMQGLDLELTTSSLKIPESHELTRHLRRYLSKPLALKLETRGLHRVGGCRAFGITPHGFKLRGSWRRATMPPLLNQQFLNVSYDEAVRSRATVMEIEMFLPKLKTTSSTKSSSSSSSFVAKFIKGGSSHRHHVVVVPRVVYYLAVDRGILNPKAVVPRGDGYVQVFADKSRDAACFTTSAKMALRLKPGLVDPNWARGRTILRKGRSTGLI